MVGGERPEPDQPESGGPPVSSGEDGGSADRPGVLREIGDVSFPVSVRGYDRGAVDDYVSRVQNLVEELEVTRSPEAAVKHALEEVGERTKGILAQAGETAEEITAAARQDAEASSARANKKAEDIVANAEAAAAEILTSSQAEASATVAQAQKEAADHLQRSQDEVAALRNEAEARMRELHADTEAIRHERSQLLADIREIATRVDDVASSADARFPPPPASEQEEEGNLLSGTTDEAATAEATATEKPTNP